ncbi:MAG TPA: hypothetical protein VKY80_01030 [Croceibacterium sp.]|nr:hypothetical protein [Croceibacterium sp.]
MHRQRGLRSPQPAPVDRLGELLREGYTAIIIDLGASGLAEPEQEEELRVG